MACISSTDISSFPCATIAAPMVNFRPSGFHDSGFQSAERTMHFVQCTNTSSTLRTSASSGSILLCANRSRSHESRTPYPGPEVLQDFKVVAGVLSCVALMTERAISPSRCAAA